MVLEEQIVAKQKELNALKEINALTESMRSQLEELAVEVTNMHQNAESVANVMQNWDSIVRSISQASLSLLQYSERDYEVGVWKQETAETKEPATSPQNYSDAPLPETLVRIKINTDDEGSNG
ncbi:LAME_0D01244g1_1 [Lachancea meyersii CBS 8951]|uniref:DASH complex subunit DAD2 n=1 Tax=Lachancea meyersii CBS 8951 TaxID=1266667 RepID=A0A1G4J6E1_9SACH|nr:LAME_0D01244g1_1 [Lachancea meyersii CBS 8951]